MSSPSHPSHADDRRGQAGNRCAFGRGSPFSVIARSSETSVSVQLRCHRQRPRFSSSMAESRSTRPTSQAEVRTSDMSSEIAPANLLHAAMMWCRASVLIAAGGGGEACCPRR